jgi:C4-dicarboxylate-specific signal transduction histidine kinase
VTATHLDHAGKPCAEHPARIDDLLGLATLGATAFSVLHDVASGLQALAAAIDELEAYSETAEPNEELRAAIVAASSALQSTNKLFVDARRAVRGGGHLRDVIRIDSLVQRAIDRADARVAPMDSPPATEVAVLIPIMTHIIASLIDTAAGTGRAEVAVSDAGDQVEVAIRAVEPERPPLGVGTTLAIAAGVISDHGGSLQCDRDGDRARFAIRLPRRSA